MSDIKAYQKYKFYLAFENGNCKGYVSEKLPKAFIWNLVPVVGGPADGARHCPSKHSCIFTEDFPTAEALGNYLNKVGSSKELYNAYHSWRANPAEITEDFRNNFPPQSSRPGHDLCKFVDVWKYQRLGKTAQAFGGCNVAPRAGGI